jgi:hypothetical protein
MRSRNIATPALLVVLSLLASCAGGGLTPCDGNQPCAKAEPKPVPLKRGPTLTLDEQAKLADPTTLQLLEERSTELAKQKKRVEELENELRQRGHEIDKVRDDSKSRSREKEQLEGLLRDATESERAANEKAISAEIARLKFEQEVLKMKLGNMLKENP